MNGRKCQRRINSHVTECEGTTERRWQWVPYQAFASVHWQYHRKFGWLGWRRRSPNQTNVDKGYSWIPVINGGLGVQHERAFKGKDMKLDSQAVGGK
ncbi:hypothetical protein BDFG_05368 [Blastomyces dermatitidis ATCC 26199]|nr:hypothetical protein BDFG_05368 [Blastomyces dermatitidis ATCC 26199]